jgi:hypothetical protein
VGRVGETPVQARRIAPVMEIGCAASWKDSSTKRDPRFLSSLVGKFDAIAEPVHGTGSRYQNKNCIADDVRMNSVRERIELFARQRGAQEREIVRLTDAPSTSLVHIGERGDTNHTHGPRRLGSTTAKSSMVMCGELDHRSDHGARSALTGRQPVGSGLA